MQPAIKILVVDDSAFVRKVLKELFATSPLIQVVGSARDGAEALELVPAVKPDLIICDLQMPKMNGVDYVRRQMAVAPLPILILSAASPDAEQVVDALSAGAIDVLQKPTALATDELRTIGERLIRKVQEVAGARVRNPTSELRTFISAKPESNGSKAAIVVMGISTGGPQALREVLPLFPEDFQLPIAVVLHMPVGYTAMYAERLNAACKIHVKEAAEGDELQPGHALIAAAGRHLTFRRSANDVISAHLPYEPIDKVHRPSVDVLFRSAAETFGNRVLAVVMTGMGNDGTEGAGWIKAQGGTVITQDEATCVIYGMPRAVMEAGLSDLAVPLHDIAKAVLTRS